MNNKLFKLAKMILNLGSVKTNNGELNWEGTLEVSTEVFVTNDENELVSAPDGTYETDSQIISVAEGRVISIEDKATEEQIAPEPVEVPVEEPMEEPEETPVEEPETDERDAQIEELQNRINELEAENADLRAQLEAKNTENEELSNQLKMSAAEPLKNNETKEKKNTGLTFRQF